MRILQVCNRYYPSFGGLEGHVKNVSEKITELGHEVMVYTTDSSGKLPESEKINGVCVRRFKCFSPGEAYYFSLDLYKAVKKSRSDIVHGHDLHGFPLLAAALAKGTRKLVATLHTGGSSSAVRDLLRVPYDGVFMHNILKRAEKIVCVSEYELRTYRRILNLPEDRFVYIPNGTDFTSFSTRTGQKDSRTILSVGRLERSKGFHFLIQSFAIVGKDKRYDDTHLTIVGKGPYEHKLHELTKELGIAERVSILHDLPREELERLYLQSDIFALFSKYESAAIVVLDALALQKPIITSRGGVLADYVDEGLSVGVSWPPSPNEAAEKMKKMLDNPSNYRPRKANVLSWNDVAKRLISLYESILTQQQDRFKTNMPSNCISSRL